MAQSWAKVGHKRSLTTSYGTKANTSKRSSQEYRGPQVMAQRPIWAKDHRESIADHKSWLEGQFGQKIIVRVSRTTSHGSKANLGKSVGCEASRTTSKYGTKANMGKRLVARASRTTGNHGTKANTGKGWLQTSWTTSKYGTKANIVRHRGPRVIMGKRSEPPSSWAKGHHGQKVRTTVIVGKRVGHAWDCWTTSYGMQANLGKGRSHKRSRITSYGMKAILGKRYGQLGQVFSMSYLWRWWWHGHGQQVLQRQV
jgi:hypothetical protein